jgi:hypothetical protein
MDSTYRFLLNWNTDVICKKQNWRVLPTVLKEGGKAQPYFPHTTVSTTQKQNYEII